MKRALTLAYAAVAYVVALANLAYLIGFLAGWLVPKTVHDGSPGDPWLAAAVDLGLVLGFGAQHSLFARARFKRWWTRWVPPAIERATYLYLTAIASAVLVVLWRPIEITIWQVQSPPLLVALGAVYMAIWLMMFAATFHFGHLSFFGLRQAVDAWRRRRPAPASFTSRYLYSLVRHPISLGWMVLPLFTAHMTVGLLVWALGSTAYVLVATWFEERDLVEELGQDYVAYRRRVPAFLPRPRAAQTLVHRARAVVGMPYRQHEAEGQGDTSMATFHGTAGDTTKQPGTR